MCMPKTPKYTPPPAPPEAPVAPKMVDASVQSARTNEQKQARLKAGRSGTVLTNPSITSTSSTAATGKTLLGQ